MGTTSKKFLINSNKPEERNTKNPNTVEKRAYQRYQRSIIKVIAFLLFFFFGIPIIFSYFIPFSIFFLLDLVAIGGWFVPAIFNKYPFFYEKFKFHIKALVITQFVALFVIPFVFPILGMIDVYYNLAISKSILGSFFNILKIPFFPPFVAFSLPFLIKQIINFIKRVQLIISPVLRKSILWGGRIEKHYRSQSWKKGMPILINNGTNHPLVVSRIVLQAYISDLPIHFLKTHYGIWESKIHKEHTTKISRQNPIQRNSSEILVIPWGEIKKLFKKLIPFDSWEKTRLFIELSDEFAGKIYSSPEIDSRRLFNDMAYYTHWIKQLPKTGE